MKFTENKMEDDEAPTPVFNFRIYKSTIIHDYRRRSQLRLKQESCVVEPKSKIIRKRCYKKRPITNCDHTDEPHYAKGMCKRCYGQQGRDIKARDCDHIDKPHFALGKCKTCYFKFYNEKLRPREPKQNENFEENSAEILTCSQEE